MVRCARIAVLLRLFRSHLNIPRMSLKTSKPMSGYVQVFGRRRDGPIHALMGPASEKRQSTKSLRHRGCGYGDLTVGTEARVWDGCGCRKRDMTAGGYADGGSLLFFLGLFRGCDSRSSGLSTLAIMPVATRV